MNMVDIKHGFVTARGVRHHVAEAGSGPPLVLLHGWPEFWAAWEPIFARLAGRYRLIAPDFRGFGESENPHPGPTDTVNGSRSPTISSRCWMPWTLVAAASLVTTSAPT